ncbi:MAG: dUTPase [Epsilonproteobacteria bacterium]|nr:dUTPase [Campylobacterota bacterium]
MRDILEMLRLQQRLNDSTNGENWEYGVTKSGKVIDWNRCIYMEVAELINSYPWKHWKDIDAKADYENIKIEIVDIWHFVMSEALRVYRVEERGDIDMLARDISNIALSIDGKSIDHSNIYREIGLVEEILNSIFSKSGIDDLISKFFKVVDIALDRDELYRLYIGKNVLNIFRQNNGYRDGTYLKVWGDREDNVVLQDIVDSNRDITADTLYSKLEIEYRKYKV